MSSLVSIILILAIAVGLALTLGSGGSVTFFWQGYRADLALATFFILMLFFSIFHLYDNQIVFSGVWISWSFALAQKSQADSEKAGFDSRNYHKRFVERCL